MARTHSRGPRGRRRQTDVSRRDFFKTVGAGSVAAAVVASGSPADAQPAVVGPAEVAIALTINGQRQQLKVEPRVWAWKTMNWSLISETNSSTSSPREPAVTIAIWIVSSGT